MDYPATGGAGVLAVAVTLLCWDNRNVFMLFDMDPSAFGWEPWRLLTSALPHGDIFHLGFNLYVLWLFGTIVEEIFGWLRTVGMMAMFAAGSAAAEYVVCSGGIGLSGVVFGLFGFLWILSRRDIRFFGIIDHRTIRWFVGLFFVLILLTYFGIMNIANVAHGAGCALGMMLAEAVAGRDEAKRVLEFPRRRIRRQVFTIALPVALVALWAVAAFARPYVNLSGRL